MRSTRHLSATFAALAVAVLFPAAAAGQSPPGSLPGLPYVHVLRTEPAFPCASRPTTLLIEGVFPDGCGRVVGSRVIDPGHVELTLRPHALPDTACTLALQPWRAKFDLGLLPAGDRVVRISLIVLVPDPTTSTGYRREQFEGRHAFHVSERCDTPPPGPLPYVHEIVVGSRTPCGPVPPCPGDSIGVWVSGVFPHDCFTFRGIQLVPSPIMAPFPVPPIVRIIVDDGGCLGRPCIQREVRWGGFAVLPPLRLPMEYLLQVELAQVSCADTYPPGQLFHTLVPFAVRDSCPPRPPCLNAGFVPGPDGPSGCNAIVSPRRPADLTFQVGPSVALAGLQGEFVLRPDSLRITALEAIGPAEGMHLSWEPTPRGARFLLFAEQGAPIPPPPAGDMRMPTPGGWPVLRITVEQPAQGQAPEVTLVTTEGLLGSDIDGHGVPLCPPPPCVATTPQPGLDPRLAGGLARICAEGRCDFNGDGLQDIRDIVRMVHCVQGMGACPPDAAIRFDCNGDGEFGMADVFCCARHILARPPCPDCPRPDPGGARPEPSVAVRFDAPVETAAGVDLPIVIAGADRLGGALLTLELPLERYDVTGIENPTGGRWLALHETREGRLVLGMIDLQPGRLDLQAGPLTLVLRLSLRPGQAPGGRVVAVAGEFSGPDGAVLAVDLGSPSLGLPGGEMALGRSHPNPFSSETRFTLQLAEAADVAVAIYDLRGRTVAMLFRGRLPSGPREFTWDGRADDGSVAPRGVYFYQASIAGRTLARKLVLLRGD